MQEIKLNGESMNIVEDNIEKLKTIFPDVFTEGKVDFEKLQGVLGNYIETNDERYNFTWAGKQNALRLAQTPSTGTLRPCKEESKNWDTTQNLYIEGDNLEVLKLLQKSYHNKIKMIYIDPPYNTGNDFVYKDDFKDNIENYKKITGQVDEEGNKISSNSESDGRYHTNWLNMMYPRLRLARNLLSNDGVIFVSIDGNEVDNLKKLNNEVFGEENLVGIISNSNNPKGRSDDKFVATAHEYILIYAKNLINIDWYGFEPTEEIIKRYNKIDDNGKKYREIDLRKTGENDLREDRPNLFYYFYYNEQTKDFYPSRDNSTPNGYIQIKPQREDCKEGNWRWGLDTAKSNLDSLMPKFMPARKVWGVMEKDYLANRTLVKPTSSWAFKDINSERGSEDFIELGFDKRVFPKPKPLGTIQRCLKLSTTNEDIILDFFSGSATTAHAIMQLNSEDNGNRKFICVQLPEQTDEKSEAFKAGYKNICEIGKERIRRAGEKIKQEIGQGNQQLKLGEEPKKVPDIGFKVFKLDSSNIKKWNANTENIEKEMQSSIFNYVEGRSELDITYEVMLKCGLDLTYPIEEIKVEDKTLYSVGAGAMFICMDDRITQSIADKIIAIKEENEIEEPVVVFKDNGFIDDSTKSNTKESLRVAGIKDFITV